MQSKSEFNLGTCRKSESTETDWAAGKKDFINDEYRRSLVKNERGFGFGRGIWVCRRSWSDWVRKKGLAWLAEAWRRPKEMWFLPSEEMRYFLTYNNKKGAWCNTEKSKRASLRHRTRTKSESRLEIILSFLIWRMLIDSSKRAIPPPSSKRREMRSQKLFMWLSSSNADSKVSTKLMSSAFWKLTKPNSSKDSKLRKSQEECQCWS